MTTRSDKMRPRYRKGSRKNTFPFSLFFVTPNDGGKTHSFTRFTENREELREGMKAGLSLTENQDVGLYFKAPPDFRFTMDGLDVVSLPGTEKINGQVYIRPGGKYGDPVSLFEGKDFPLVPGYYVVTVSGNGRNWYGILEITPKFMGKQSWQEMRDELVGEIRDLSFDFMKRSMNISKSLESRLRLNAEMLLRFYTISDESERVLKVLGELSRTANARLTMKREILPRSETGKEAHLQSENGKIRQGAPSFQVKCKKMTWDVAENRFAKAILKKLDENLGDFIRETEHHSGELLKQQEELRPYAWTRDFKTGKKALVRFRDYKERAVKIRNAIRAVTGAPWFREAGDRMPQILPMTVFRDARYAVLYNLYRNLRNPLDSVSVSSFYQFQWKRTDKLYELWCFLQFIKALEKKDWEIETGPAVIKEEGRYRLSSLEGGAAIILTRGEEKVRLVYDGSVPQSSAETDRAGAPLYTNNSHRRPDFRMDCYKGDEYFGSLAADFKYRDIFFLWRDPERSAGIRSQFNAYRDMNTKFYRDMTETESLRNSRPVKEVWAVFPKEIPEGSDDDFNLRFISLAPGLKANEKLADMLENYIESLH